jgi:hypothetical protein
LRVAAEGPQLLSAFLTDASMVQLGILKTMIEYDRAAGCLEDAATKLSRSEKTLLSLTAACRYTYCTMTNALGLRKLGALMMVRLCPL